MLLEADSQWKKSPPTSIKLLFTLKSSMYNENRYGEYFKETTTPPGWKSQPKTTNWFLMNRKETLI